MAVTNVPLTNPTILKDVSLVIGDQEFKEALESVLVKPSASVKSWIGIGGVTITDTDPATWTIDATYVQDWESTNSLSRYLHTHAGEQVVAVFKPSAAADPTVTATITLTPGAIGGAAGLAKSTVSFGVQGTPELGTDAA